MSSSPSDAPAGAFLGSGTIIAGKYRLESFIAKGGMGEVWVATNLVLESKVALKVLRRSLAESPEASARLLREARAAARINHNNIVQVFDFGYIETGEPFIVMELLRGESLGDRLERAIRIPAVSAVEILVPVAHALAAAHSKGIVHRDLKPWNIFLAVDESNLEIPKVVDFGIAKVAVKHDARVTQQGHVLGSPEYLSPEQALGDDDIDARADVWALAVTLYETITGTLPFQDEVYNRLLRKIVESEPTTTVGHGAGDYALWKIIDKGLRKKREDRWQSAADMGAALEAWLENLGVYTTGSLFQKVVENASGGEPAVPTLTALDIPTRNSPAVPAKPAARPRTWAWIASAAVIVLGLAAITWVLVSGRPKETASALSASASAAAAPSTSAPVVAPPATMSAAPPLEPTASAAPIASAPPAKSAAGPGRTGPATTKGAAGKTHSVPAIPTEPNF
ncbi:MAG: serine/threonine protein kinase [Deltaproteobacteria bacterium]|nr:serine/threonine protein kinase [Deltaproteobacteria bacterium]